LLKARTGAHEVIVTIMLNYVAYYLLLYALSRKFLLQAPGSSNPQSAPVAQSAILPKILGDQYSLHLGFLLALVAVAAVWWLLNRSTLGYRIRAVGLNPNAARVAGVSVGRTYTQVMAIAGGLVGLAGINQVLGTVTSGLTADLDAGIGFDAITVALLGRSRPVGILLAGLLFGAFKAGGFTMQSSRDISVDLVLVVQSLIVLFLAAPPLVRAIFRLPRKEEM
jgi:simple sugar transport system permease protein